MTLIKRFLFMYKAMSKLSKYLDNGIYRIQANMRVFQKKNAKTANFPIEKFPLKRKLVYWMEKIIPVFVFTKRDNKLFLGRAVYFSNMTDIFKSDMKIFDFENKRILTICPTYNRWKTVLSQKEEAGRKFPIPYVYMKNEKTLSYAEELIESFASGNSSYSFLFEKVFSWYCTYYTVRENCVTVDKIMGVPLFYQHGDLSTDNVILNKNEEICFIDFDHCGMYPIFYDIFYIALFLLVSKNDNTFLEELVHGRYREKITEILDEFYGVDFNLCLTSFIDVYKNYWVKNLPEYHRTHYEKIFDSILK